jgi:hypothetical protein
MRNVCLALVAFTPLSAQACEGTYRGTISQSFMNSSQSGDIEIVVSGTAVSGFLMGHTQKIKRPLSGTVDGACQFVGVTSEGPGGKFAYTGSPEKGSARSMGADAPKLQWTAKKVD